MALAGGFVLPCPVQDTDDSADLRIEGGTDGPAALTAEAGRQISPGSRRPARVGFTARSVISAHSWTGSIDTHPARRIEVSSPDPWSPPIEGTAEGDRRRRPGSPTHRRAMPHRTGPWTVVTATAHERRHPDPPCDRAGGDDRGGPAPAAGLRR